MKKLLCCLVGILTICSLSAQSRMDKTILFLVPFHLEQAEQINIDSVSTENDLYEIPSFDLIGFWEGAKMALDEYDRKFVNLNVIVRDVTNNAKQLQNILQEAVAHHKIDLIIGPFYGKMFAIASSFAKEHHIPIVNPFSTRSNIVNDNEFAYKVLPPTRVYPHLTDSLIIKRYPKNNVILWVASDEMTDEQQEYEQYFDSHNIPYRKVAVSENVNALHQYLKPHYQNIVIALFDNEATVTNHVQNYTITDYSKPVTMIVPEKWLSINTIEFEYFNRLNVHYFSNYFVDYKEDKTEYFSINFINQYAYPPSLTRFSFQGYDITKYFIQKLFHHENDPDNFYYSLGFQFKKTPNGGYENQRARLIMIENYEKVEIK